MGENVYVTKMGEVCEAKKTFFGNWWDEYVASRLQYYSNALLTSLTLTFQYLANKVHYRLIHDSTIGELQALYTCGIWLEYTNGRSAKI